jgi:hypothetical protein
MQTPLEYNFSTTTRNKQPWPPGVDRAALKRKKIMTYCDKTGPDEFALYMNGNQLMYLSEKLRNDKSQQAEALKNAIYNELNTNEMHPISKQTSLETCDLCRGAGKIRTYNKLHDQVKFITCPKCKGKRLLLKSNTIRYQPVTENIDKQFIPYPGIEISDTDLLDGELNGD